MKTKNPSVSLLAGAILAQAVPTLGWLLEQYLTQAMPVWWSIIPWGWLLLLVFATWIGFFLNELTRDDSSLRKWLDKRSAIATISFDIDRPADINKAQTVSVQIEIKRPSQRLGCYARYAIRVAYLNGKSEWKWSDQQELCEEGRDISPGKIIKKNLSTIQRSDDSQRRVEVLGHELKTRDSPFEQLFAVEIVVTSKSRTVTRREVFQVIQSKKATLIPSKVRETSDFVDV